MTKLKSKQTFEKETQTGINVVFPNCKEVQTESAETEQEVQLKQLVTDLIDVLPLRDEKVFDQKLEDVYERMEELGIETGRLLHFFSSRIAEMEEWKQGVADKIAPDVEKKLLPGITDQVRQEFERKANNWYLRKMDFFEKQAEDKEASHKQILKKKTDIIESVQKKLRSQQENKEVPFDAYLALTHLLSPTRSISKHVTAKGTDNTSQKPNTKSKSKHSRHSSQEAPGQNVDNSDVNKCQQNNLTPDVNVDSTKNNNLKPNLVVC